MAGCLNTIFFKGLSFRVVNPLYIPLDKKTPKNTKTVKREKEKKNKKNRKRKEGR